MIELIVSVSGGRQCLGGTIAKRHFGTQIHSKKYAGLGQERSTANIDESQIFAEPSFDRIEEQDVRQTTS